MTATAPRLRTEGVRVCHLTSVHPPYDTRIFEKECLSLVAAGYDVHLVAPMNGRAQNGSSERVRGVTIASVAPSRGRLARAVVTTARVFARALGIRARLYHFHDPELLPVGILLRVLGKRVIYDVHEEVPADILDKAYLPRWTRGLLARIVDIGERWAARGMSGIVAATPTIARRFSPARSVVVQNFPSPGEFPPSSEHPYATRGPVAAYVGLINELRGATEMVRAVEHVAAQQRATLVLAGRFDTAALEARARALPGWRHVDYRGTLAHAAVVPMLAEARLGLVLFHPRPNHMSAQPNKLFEYMAAGLPVVASRFPLWQEIVEGSRCGLLVDPLDPREIGAAIAWLFEHPAEAEAMGARGRAAVRDRFNWPCEAATLLRCYARLCAS